MSHPYQRVAVTQPATLKQGDSGFLIAACGPRVVASSLTSGTVVSQWPVNREETENGQGAEHPDERPSKKQKTEPKSQPLPNIIDLTVSPNGQHAVAVTDDKCVRVLEVRDDGRLVELSGRYMPKRPCAIAILPDSTTILCGDKFGDVYSLPLLPELSEGQANGGTEAQQPPAPAQPYKPTATNLTVHTQRNRRALEAQLKQQNIKAKTKEPLRFEHSVLLGHVSMLTDVAFATREVDGRPRGYIITADRDEHIRVSRGPPQSHVIEGYCLGHTEFVSKVCFLPELDLLVSGGGDDWLGVWDMSTYQLRHRLEFRQAVLRGKSRDDADFDRLRDSVAVTGIWAVPLSVGGRKDTVVVVAFERLSNLLLLPASGLSGTGKIELSAHEFDLPVLDVAVFGSKLLVSFDARLEGQTRLRAYEFTSNGADGSVRSIKLSPTASDITLTATNALAAEIGDTKHMDNLLYSTANLRKRSGQNEGDEGGEDNE